MLLWQQRTARSRCILFVHFVVLSVGIHSLLLAWLCIMGIERTGECDIYLRHPIHTIGQEVVFVPLHQIRHLPYNDLCIKKGSMAALLYAKRQSVGLVGAPLSYDIADTSPAHLLYVYATVGDIVRYRQYRAAYAHIMSYYPKFYLCNDRGIGCTMIELGSAGTIKQMYNDAYFGNSSYDEAIKSALCNSPWPLWAHGKRLRLWW